MDAPPALSFDEAGALRLLEPGAAAHTRELEGAARDFADRASRATCRAAPRLAVR
jgi:hypothetical protein